jgi:hypothetical protein
VITVTNIYCTVAVNSKDDWQKYVVQFWQRLHDSAPNERLRQAYANKLLREKTREFAMDLLK